MAGPLEAPAPLTSYSYDLTVTGIMTAYFTSVSGLGVGLEVNSDFVSQRGQSVRTRSLGRTTYSQITLERGVCGDKGLQQWVDMAAQGQEAMAKRTATLTMYEGAMDIVAMWQLEECLPVSLSIGRVSADSGSPLVETLVLDIESFSRMT